MTENDKLLAGLEAALLEAKSSYRKMVIQLAILEAQKDDSGVRVLADTQHVHTARTRVIALEAAIDELKADLAEPGN